MTRSALLAVLAAVSMLPACAGPEEEVCAALVRYAEPVLTIDSVRGPGGRAVDTILLTDPRLDGVPMTREVRDGYGEQFGLDAGRGRGLTCAVPCGFGNESGNLTFDVSTADGLHAAPRLAVTYGGSHGCGPVLDDGTHVDLELEDRPTGTPRSGAR